MSSRTDRPIREPKHGYPLSLGNEWKRATGIAAGTMTPAEAEADRIADGQRMIRQCITEAMQLLHDQGVTADEYADFLTAQKHDEEQREGVR